MFAASPLLWMVHALRWLPRPLTSLLDAWSYSVARKRASRRKAMAERRRLEARMRALD